MTQLQAEAGFSPGPADVVSLGEAMEIAPATPEPRDAVLNESPVATTRAGALSSASLAVAAAAQPKDATLRGAAEPATRPAQTAAEIVPNGQPSGVAPPGAASPGAAPSGSSGSSGAPSAWLPSAQLLMLVLALLAAVAVAARRPQSMAYAPATYPD